MKTELKPQAELVEVDFDVWPNFSTPDCEFKTTHGSDKCYGCTMGLPMQTMEQYQDSPVLSDEEFEERHQRLLNITFRSETR